jgi:hypothetical protein
MSVWNTSAAERVASLREQALRYEDPTAQLSDLELLNAAYESVLREQIDTRDRYMGLLTSLRGHDDRVRAGAVAGFRPQIDRVARHVVREHLRPFEYLVDRVEHLPSDMSRDQVASLRSSAATVRHGLREEGPAEEQLDPGDARHALSTLRSVVATLQGRQGVTAEEALRLMDSALHDGPLLDLFHIGTPRPLPETPSPGFAGAGWTQQPGTWTYQPAPDGGFVKTYPLGEEWYVDLWSARGQLLAHGTAQEADIAALAPALVEQAETWSRDRSEYAWRRFADTAEATRAAEPPPRQAPANPPPAPPRPEEGRVRAATTTSPSRTAAPSAAATKLPASPLPAPAVTHTARDRHR